MLDYSGNLMFCAMSRLLCCPLADLHMPNVNNSNFIGSLLRGSIDAVQDWESFLKNIVAVMETVAKLSQMWVWGLYTIWLRSIDIYPAYVFIHEKMSLDDFDRHLKFPVAWLCAKFYLITTFVGARPRWWLKKRLSKTHAHSVLNFSNRLHFNIWCLLPSA